MAAANRRAFVALGIGTAIIAALFWIAVSVTPLVSPKEMVRVQLEHGELFSPGPKTGSEPLSWSNASRSTLAVQPLSAPMAGYLPVGFNQLAAFPFIVTDEIIHQSNVAQVSRPGTLDQIPDHIRALNSKEVAVTGFMLPVNVQRGLTTDFLILRNQSMCCYGIPPKITEWVNVHLAGKGVKPLMDQPITVCGTFHVGEVRENGDLVGIYRLDAEKIKKP